MLNRDKRAKSQEVFERYQRKLLMELNEVGFEDTMTLATGEEETDEAIKTDKKKELREHQKII